MNEIKRLRSIINHSVEQILFLKDHRYVTKEVKGAIEEFEKEFLGNYRKLREDIYSASSIHEQSIKENSLKVFEIKKILENFFQLINYDLYNVSRLESIVDLTKAFISGERKDLSEKTNRVADDLSLFAQIRKMFSQIRLLDSAGKERVRVNFSNNNTIIVSRNELQDKSGRYYFREAMLLKPGEVYVSPLDLNKENGKIEIPFKPVIRYALPVYIDEEIGGIVVFNILIDTETILNAPWGEEVMDYDNDIMVNQNGFYLHHPDRSKTWGFMDGLGRSAENIKNDFSGDVDKILSDSDEAIRFSPVNSVIYSPFFYHPEDKKKFWVIIQPVKNLLYPLSAEAWVEKSTKAINTAIAISNAANKKAHNDIEKMATSSKNRLMMSAFLLLIAVTIFSLFLLF